MLYAQSDYSLAAINSSIALLMYDNEIVPIDMQTGLQLQAIPMLSDDNWQPHLLGDRMLNHDERGVALIDPSTGEEVWRLDGPTEERSRAFMGHQMIVHTSSGAFAVISPITGDIIWRGDGFVLDTLDDARLLWNSGE
jgi:hypothetical protein